MAMYDQSLQLAAADRRYREASDRARFYESSARRWRRAFDQLASQLDEDDPATRDLIDECERAREEIPLEYPEVPA